MTFSDSPVGSGKTPMKCQSKESLASGHFLAPVLHRRLADQYRQLTALCLYTLGRLSFFFTMAMHRRFTNSSCDSL
ncbi:hypothetical protein HAX54_014122, partial [Datura stramonium]|nr:hypothetical protein [Datura stramonium]